MDFEKMASDQEFLREFYDLLGAYLPGEMTLNQIRTLQYIYLCSKFRGEPATHAEICAALRLSPTTVSRAIANFLERGLIRNEPDPGDGRRRLLAGTRLVPEGDFELTRRVSQLFDRLRERAETP